MGCKCNRKLYICDIHKFPNSLCEPEFETGAFTKPYKSLEGKKSPDKERTSNKQKLLTILFYAVIIIVKVIVVFVVINSDIYFTRHGFKAEFWMHKTQICYLKLDPPLHTWHETEKCKELHTKKMSIKWPWILSSPHKMKLQKNQKKKIQRSIAPFPDNKQNLEILTITYRNSRIAATKISSIKIKALL